MILPKKRDPRFITMRRGGTLSDEHHYLLALWAADCAEHVLHLFEQVQPDDKRPCQAIEQIRAWTRGEISMMQSRSAGGHAMAAARELKGAARNAAFAAGQAAVVAHVAAHELAGLELLDILSSDYVPAALLLAAAKLGEIWGDMARGMATVTSAPAQAVALDDRGELAIGKRADVIRFRMRAGAPALAGVWSRGNRAA